MIYINKISVLNVFKWIWSISWFMIKLYNEKNKYVNVK